MIKGKKPRTDAQIKKAFAADMKKAAAAAKKRQDKRDKARAERRELRAAERVFADEKARKAKLAAERFERDERARRERLVALRDVYHESARQLRIKLRGRLRRKDRQTAAAHLDTTNASIRYLTAEIKEIDAAFPPAPTAPSEEPAATPD